MEYLGYGDKQEMVSIAGNIYEYILENEYNVEMVFNEVVPFEYSLDANDLEYVKYLVYKLGGFELC